jgi:DNA-binding transcriptional MerR regulator
VPDYILEEHLSDKLDLLEKDLLYFESRGLIRGELKNGNTYYSSRDFYRLKGVLHYMRNKGLSLEEAQARVVWVSYQPVKTN